MTTNQIAYWNLQEQKRTNRANEDIKTADVVEKGRSNKANEKLQAEKNAETHRSNKRNEDIKVADVVVKGLGAGAQLYKLI